MYARNGTFLTGDQIRTIYQSELRAELERAIAPIYRSSNVSETLWQTSLMAEAYGVARRLERPDDLNATDVAAITAKGFKPGEVEFIRCDLDLACNSARIANDDIAIRLLAAGVAVDDDAIECARLHLLRARAEAYRRAGYILDPVVQDAPDPVEALLGPTFDRVAPAAAAQPSVSVTPVVQPPPQPEGADCPFLVFDRRRFSDVIDDIVDQLKRDRTWKGDCSQQRRILRTFAWITGDKMLGDYNHLDVDTFKRGLQRLPVTFRFGTLTSGAMSSPFDIAALPEVAKGEERNAKTVNRDLSTMSTVARHLGKTAWKPKMPNATILDFAGACTAIKDDGVDPRPPWTSTHLQRLFESPIYAGGGGARQRLKTAKAGRVWHDAAYFAPLLWYYHQACREEICGLRVDEVFCDHAIPHFKIQDNDVRGRDGELAGEKRIARRRALPLHPELLRLGFVDYVRAVQAEGHSALFPELYINEAKRGGAQFYAVAWRFMVEWLAESLPIPRNRNGKGPDIHSIRALGSSFYEKDGVNEIVRADVMGHARTGTNAKHYSKRLATEGLEVVLQERLEFITRYVPNITSDVPAAPIKLLPIEARSRVGSGRYRKIRADAGKARPIRGIP